MNITEVVNKISIHWKWTGSLTLSDLNQLTEKAKSLGAPSRAKVNINPTSSMITFSWSNLTASEYDPYRYWKK